MASVTQMTVSWIFMPHSMMCVPQFRKNLPPLWPYLGSISIASHSIAPTGQILKSVLHDNSNDTNPLSKRFSIFLNRIQSSWIWRHSTFFWGIRKCSATWRKHTEDRHLIPCSLVGSFCFKASYCLLCKTETIDRSTWHRTVMLITATASNLMWNANACPKMMLCCHRVTRSSLYVCMCVCVCVLVDVHMCTYESAATD